MIRNSIALAFASLVLAGCGAPDENPEALAQEGATPVASSEAALEAWIRAQYATYGRIGYRSAETDLDGDGAPEVVVYVGGSGVCGADGCNLVVLRREGAAFSKISETSVARLPVGQLDSESNDWADLWVTVADGGELTGRRVLRFDGASYPSSPGSAEQDHVEVLSPLVLIPDGELIWLD